MMPEREPAPAIRLDRDQVEAPRAIRQRRAIRQGRRCPGAAPSPVAGHAASASPASLRPARSPAARAGADLDHDRSAGAPDRARPRPARAADTHVPPEEPPAGGDERPRDGGLRLVAQLTVRGRGHRAIVACATRPPLTRSRTGLGSGRRRSRHVRHIPTRSDRITARRRLSALLFRPDGTEPWWCSSWRDRALRAALALQERFSAELPRGVGIGLDAGEAIPVHGGHRGSALNLAARPVRPGGPGRDTRIRRGHPPRGEGRRDRVHGSPSVPPQGHGRPRPGGPRRGGGARAEEADPVRTGHDGRSASRCGGRRRGAGRDRRGRRPHREPWRRREPDPRAIASSVDEPHGRHPAPPDTGPLAGVDLPVLAFIDPATGKITDTKPIHEPTDIAGFVDGRYWVYALDPKAIHQVDPATHETIRRIAIPLTQEGFVTVDGGTIWVADRAAPRVIALDVRTGVQVHDYPVGIGPEDDQPASSVAVGAGSLWVALPGNGPQAGEIIRVDPKTGTIQRRIGGLDSPDVLAFGDGALWVTGSGAIVRIDPATNEVTFITKLAEAFLLFIAFAGATAWTASDELGKVWKVDRAGRATEYEIGIGARGLALLGGTMWVAVQDQGKLVGIDTTSGARREIVTGHQTVSVAAGHGQLLVTVDRTPEETIAAIDGDVLTISAPYGPFYAPGPTGQRLDSSSARPHTSRARACCATRTPRRRTAGPWCPRSPRRCRRSVRMGARIPSPSVTASPFRRRRASRSRRRRTARRSSAPCPRPWRAVTPDSSSRTSSARSLTKGAGRTTSRGSSRIATASRSRLSRRRRTSCGA